MTRILLINAVVQLLSILAFILVTKSYQELTYKVLVIVIFTMITIGLNSKIVSDVKHNMNYLLALMLGVTFIVVYQTIGYSYYTGLVKGISFLSSRYLFNTLIILGISTAFYLCCLFISKFLIKLKQTLKQ
jgi:hypothetical protein